MPPSSPLRVTGEGSFSNSNKMKSRSRILILLSAVILAVVYFFPLWWISLEAPQYPDGIKMYIWVNKITGQDENTIQNINILNHYIGMKYIEPDSIPELKYFPWVIASLIGTGLLIGFLKWRKVAFVWIAMLTLLSILGLYDFWMWEYDYGHNLDPKAPIKVEGQAYQPPFLGTKWLLNFKATSWPHGGGIALFISVILANLVWLTELRKK